MSEPEQATDRPMLNLEFNRVLCSRHGEPFRAKWPSGYAAWVLFGFEAVVQLESFQAETGGDQFKIELALDKTPICCRLGDGKVRELFNQIHEKCHVWDQSGCSKCGRLALGSPIRTTNYWGRVKDQGFVCFDCWFNRFVPLQRN